VVRHVRRVAGRGDGGEVTAKMTTGRWAVVLTRRHGLLVEVTDEANCMGIRRCWISDKRPDSPTVDQILGYGKGRTLAEAVDEALEQLALRLNAKEGA
jgi:hypothetical protein